MFTMPKLSQLLACISVLLIASSAFAGDPSLSGETYISYSGVLTVRYNTGGETLWIGASVMDEDGDIRDLPPSRISGSGTKTWTMVGGYDEARISIWAEYDSDNDRMIDRLADTGWF